MMRCHICGEVLDIRTLEDYFNEIQKAHYNSAVPGGWGHEPHMVERAKP